MSRNSTSHHRYRPLQWQHKKAQHRKTLSSRALLHLCLTSTALASTQLSIMQLHFTMELHCDHHMLAFLCLVVANHVVVVDNVVQWNICALAPTLWVDVRQEG